MAASSMNESLTAIEPTFAYNKHATPKPLKGREYTTIPTRLASSGNGIIHNIISNKEVRLQLAISLRLKGGVGTNSTAHPRIETFK